VALHGGRAERDRGERDLQAALVTRVADRDAGIRRAKGLDIAAVGKKAKTKSASPKSSRKEKKR